MKSILIFGLALLLPGLVDAQVSKERDVIGAAGQHSSAGGMEVSWTVGEVAVNSSENPGIIVLEGFQQADEGALGLSEENFDGEISVYPNPVDDVIHFDIKLDQSKEMSGALMDLNGKEVKSIPAFSVLEKHSGELNVQELPAGKWILRFTSVDGEFQKSFNLLIVR